MARGWKVGRVGFDVVEGEWIMVPITVEGRGSLGMRIGDIFGVMMLLVWKLESDDVGKRGLEGVLETCVLVLRNWLRRGSCGMKSST